MAGIEWTDCTLNPFRARNRATGKVGWHCEHVSPACEHCYAERQNRWTGTGLPYKPGHLANVDIFLDEKMLLQPLRWERPRKIFITSTTDLFGSWVTDAMLDQAFAMMALARQHTFQLLTKRQDRMWSYITSCKTDGIVWHINRLLGRTDGDLDKTYDEWAGRIREPLPNVWLGVTAEDQERANERIPILRQTPAAIRFVSLEPLLGKINLKRIPDPYGWGSALDVGEVHGGTGQCVDFIPALDWVITGGETGPRARPMHPDWERQIRDDCAEADVPYFKKQWGVWLPWEPDGQAPFWRSQNGQLEDAHILFPEDFDADPNWDDGLWAVQESTAVFQRVGKERAGNLLDGVRHAAFPEVRI